MKIAAKFVGDLDVIKSASKRQLYGYVRPKIIEKYNQKESSKTNEQSSNIEGDLDSFIYAKHIRHPIIERLENSHEYVANDLVIGLNTENLNDFLETNELSKYSTLRIL